MKFLLEQVTAKSSDEFRNGCIPMHCGDLMSLTFQLFYCFWL